MNGRTRVVGAASLVMLATLYVPPVLLLAPTLGVHPDQLAQYQGSEFICSKDGSTISIAQVNDNFCDCADGSDEPATSACANSGGQFWCVNKGHHGKFLASSFVNDGVCDCCDGSDEDGTLVQCNNRCEDVGREIRRQLQRQIELHEAGYVKRAEFVEQGAKFREGVIARKSELESLIADLEPRLNEMQSRKESLDAAVTAQRAEMEAAKEAARKEAEQANREAEDAKAQAQAEERGLHAADDASGAAAALPVPPQPVQPQPTDESEAVDNVVEAKHGFEATHGVDVDEAEEADGSPEGGEVKAEGQETLMESKAEEKKSEEEIALEALRNEMRPLEDERAKHEKEAELASRVLTSDFSPDDAYMALFDKCFSKNVQQYEYELCLFRSAVQKEGGSSQNLGKWGKWNSPQEGEPYSIMFYENGGYCWNGPARNTKVKLVCGQDNFIVSVQEPSTCAYEMEFMTPLACSREAAQRSRKELDDMGFPMGSEQ